MEIIPLIEFITAAAAGGLAGYQDLTRSEISIRNTGTICRRISCRRCISLQNRPRNEVAVFVADRVYASYSANSPSTGGNGSPSFSVKRQGPRCSSNGTGDIREDYW
jgi:hypothetical protein